MTFLETLTGENKTSFECDFFCPIPPAESYFITGTAGIGKTFLALQTVKEALRKNPVKAEYINNRPNLNPENLAPEYESMFFEFVKAQDIIRVARQLFSNNQDEKDLAKKSMHDWKTKPVLIIDDLGAENTTEFAKATLFEIIDYRHDNKKENQTIITSNVPLEKLTEIYSDRTTSRITGMCKVIAPRNQKDLRKSDLCLTQTN